MEHKVVDAEAKFGGEEEKGIQGNFPEDKQTSETALLFLQLIMRKLRRVGRVTPSLRARRPSLMMLRISLRSQRAEDCPPYLALLAPGFRNEQLCAAASLCQI